MGNQTPRNRGRQQHDEQTRSRQGGGHQGQRNQENERHEGRSGGAGFEDYDYEEDFASEQYDARQSGTQQGGHQGEQQFRSQNDGSQRNRWQGSNEGQGGSYQRSGSQGNHGPNSQGFHNQSGFGRGGNTSFGGDEGMTGFGYGPPGNRGEHGYESQGQPQQHRGFDGNQGNAGSRGGQQEAFDNRSGTDTNRNRGQFIGHGPKGYKRSDERIQDDVCEALSQHGELDASEIECKVKDGEVTLSGTVNDRKDKRLAEDIVENCFGVNEVNNQIRVNRDGRNRRDNRSEGTHA